MALAQLLTQTNALGTDNSVRAFKTLRFSDTCPDASPFFKEIGTSLTEQKSLEIVDRLLVSNHPQAVKYLIQFLNHNIFTVRRAASDALGKLGAESAVDALIEHIQDPVVFVRKATIDALAKIEDTKAIFPLFKGIGDRELIIRNATAEAIETLGDPLGRILLDGFQSRPEAIEQIVQSDTHYILKILDAFYDGWAKDARLSTIWLLGKIKIPLFFDFLAKATVDSYSEIRAAALWALGQYKNPKSIKIFVKSLKDSHPKVRLASIWSLWSLNSIPVDNIIKVIIPLLSDRDPKIREAVVYTIIKFGAVNAYVQSIKASASDKNYKVRIATAMAIESYYDPSLNEELLLLYSDINPIVRKHIAESLVKYTLPNRVALLIDFLDDSDLDVRKTALKSLGAIGDPTAIFPLLLITADENAQIQQLAATTLSELGEPNGFLLVRFFSGDYSVLDELLKMETAHTPIMLNVINRKNSVAKTAAANYFGRTKPKIAIDPLMKMAKSWNFDERHTSMKALFQLEPSKMISYIIIIAKTALMLPNLFFYLLVFTVTTVICFSLEKIHLRLQNLGSLLVPSIFAGVCGPMQGVTASFGFVIALVVYQIPSLIILIYFHSDYGPEKKRLVR